MLSLSIHPSAKLSVKTATGCGQTKFTQMSKGGKTRMKITRNNDFLSYSKSQLTHPCDNFSKHKIIIKKIKRGLRGRQQREEEEVW